MREERQGVRETDREPALYTVYHTATHAPRHTTHHDTRADTHHDTRADIVVSQYLPSHLDVVKVVEEKIESIEQCVLG
jgi:hypothetical protein